MDKKQSYEDLLARLGSARARVHFLETETDAHRSTIALRDAALADANKRAAGAERLAGERGARLDDAIAECLRLRPLARRVEDLEASLSDKTEAAAVLADSRDKLALELRAVNVELKGVKRENARVDALTARLDTKSVELDQTRAQLVVLQQRLREAGKDAEVPIFTPKRRARVSIAYGEKKDDAGQT